MDEIVTIARHRSLHDTYLEGVRLLRQAHVANASREARWLMAAALGRDEASIFAASQGTPLDEDGARQFYRMIEERLRGRLLSRIVGRREFWSLSFEINDHVLDPRPESETLIELALSLLERHSIEPRLFLDLGCGTGCLLASLLHHYDKAHGVAVDYSVDALWVARSNLMSLGLDKRSSLVCANWADGIRGDYDVVIANPPYIASEDCPHLPQEVGGQDPLAALDGGKNGLESFDALILSVKKNVSCRFLILELGAGMMDGVQQRAKKHGFSYCDDRRDLAGTHRALALCVGFDSILIGTM